MKFMLLFVCDVCWQIVLYGVCLMVVDLCVWLRVVWCVFGRLELYLFGCGCLIVVGFLGFDYFLFMLFVLMFGCWIVLCDLKMLFVVLCQYCFDVFVVVVIWLIVCDGLLVVVFDLMMVDVEVFGYDVCVWVDVGLLCVQIVFMMLGMMSVLKLVVYDEV